MRFPKHSRRKSMVQQIKRVLAVLLAVLVVYALGSVALLARESRQAVWEMDKMSELYTNELDNKFLRISRGLYSAIMERSQPDSVFWHCIGMMQEDGSNVEYPLSKLRSDYLASAWEFGEEYRIFLYLEEEDRYYQLSIGPDGSYVGEESVERAVVDQISDLNSIPYSIKKKWNIISCNEENYMCKIAGNQGIYLGCYVNVKSILEPFYNIGMGEKGYVRLVDGEGQIVGMLTSEGISGTVPQENDDERFSIQKQLSQAPFRIQMRISGERIGDIMMGSIIVLIALAAMLIIASAMILLYLMKNILMPVQNFTQNLEKYDEGELVFQLTEGNLLELEQIDDKFKHMIHQIRKLKITLYEQELEKQKVEMDFLKLQIRPHFYLNCLNFIFSMIDFGQYDNAQKMSRITADYLTYIFRNTNEMVSVTAEAEHCQNYLRILLLRYPNSLEYYVEVHEEVEKAFIFPFLMQVFVENSAKHALTLEEKILISVTVYPEERGDEKYVNLYISDTGRGFPENILEKLQRGEDISEGGNHVGIINCMKRFRHYYQKTGEINFSNSPLGGAIVDIHIPYRESGK